MRTAIKYILILVLTICSFGFFLLLGNNQDLNKTNRELASNNEVLSVENNELKTSLTASQNDLNLKNEQLATTKAMYDEKVELVEQKDVEIAEYKISLEISNDSISSLEKEKEDLSAEIDNCEMIIEDLENKFDGLQQMYLQKNQQYNDAKSQISELQAEIETKIARITELETNNETLTGEKEQLQTEVAELQARVDELEAGLDAEEELANLQSQIDSLEAEIETKDARITELETNLADVQSQLETALAEKETIQSDLNTALAEKEELQEQVTALENQLENVSFYSPKWGFNYSGREFPTGLELVSMYISDDYLGMSGYSDYIVENSLHFAFFHTVEFTFDFDTSIYTLVEKTNRNSYPGSNSAIIPGGITEGIIEFDLVEHGYFDFYSIDLSVDYTPNSSLLSSFAFTDNLRISYDIFSNSIWIEEIESNQVFKVISYDKTTGVIVYEKTMGLGSYGLLPVRCTINLSNLTASASVNLGITSGKWTGSPVIDSKVGYGAGV